MSHEARRAVWQHSEMTGSARVLMLAIAEFTNKEKCVAWPGIETLSEYIGVNGRSVKRLIKQCEEAGELVVERNVGAGNTNVYRITYLDKGVNDDTKKGVTPDTINRTNGVSPDTKKGVKPDQKGVSRNTQSVNKGNIGTATYTDIQFPAELDSPEFAQVWFDWISHRRDKGDKDYTPLAIKSLLAEWATRGEDRTINAIRHSMSRNWSSIHEPDSNGHGAKSEYAEEVNDAAGGFNI